MTLDQTNEISGATMEPGQMVRRSVGASREIGSLQSDVAELRTMMQSLLNRSSVEQGVFDSLHAELRDYKEDFFYERLKPIVRPLLFLHDSIEDYERELSATGAPDANTMSHLRFFREQLEEVLTVCEITPIAEVSGPLDTSIHKAARFENVAPEKHGHVVGVVKSGWYLNGNLLRPVEVVQGKSRQ